MIKDGHKLYTPNNYNNRVVGPPKGKVLEGQPPRYSNQQQKFLKLFIKNNNEYLHHHYQIQHHGYSIHLHNLQLTLVVHECMY